MSNYYWKDYIIACYSLDGHYIKTYRSAREAALELNLFPRVVEKCIRGEAKKCKDMLWRRYLISEEIPLTIPPYVEKKYSTTARPVLKIGKRGTRLNLYTSIKSAADANNIDPKCIRECLKGNQKQAGGYKWMYYNKPFPRLK